VSNKLSTLVWGAKPLAASRSSLAQRLVMASLADQVDEVRHGDSCYPSIEVIGARTELSRRCVIEALGKLARNGWLQVSQKPGYGNLYRFDVEKLAAHQREKRERGISRTRAYLAPVQDATDRGASYADEGCNLALTNKEESAFKPAIESAAPRLVLSMPSAFEKQAPAPQKKVESISVQEVEAIRLAYPKKASPETARNAIHKQHARLCGGKVTTASGVALPVMAAAQATAYLLERTRLFAESPKGRAGQYLLNPGTFFNSGEYTVDEAEWSDGAASRSQSTSGVTSPVSAVEKMRRVS
jgi:hypothetical protein